MSSTRHSLPIRVASTLLVLGIVLVSAAGAVVEVWDW